MYSQSLVYFTLQGTLWINVTEYTYNMTVQRGEQTIAVLVSNVKIYAQKKGKLVNVWFYLDHIHICYTCTKLAIYRIFPFNTTTVGP